MNFGFTYDLKDDYLAAGMAPDQAAEFDARDTIDAIAAAIEAMGHRVDRIGSARALMARLGRGDRWDLVFNIAESTGGFGREALVPALLESFGIPYTMSDPLVCAVTLHKASAKRILRDAGIPTPRFAVVESAADLVHVEGGGEQALRYPLFAKPIAEGSSKGIEGNAKCSTAAELDRLCGRLLERYRQPVLVEEFLPGREVTVGVLGTGAAARAIGVQEIVMLEGAEPEVYSYQNKVDWEGKVQVRLATGPIVDEASHLALATWRVLGARDCGRVDLRADATGRLQVLEVNPLPGLRPGYSDLALIWGFQGREYGDLIREIVESAMERAGEEMHGAG